MIGVMVAGRNLTTIPVDKYELKRVDDGIEVSWREGMTFIPMHNVRYLSYVEAAPVKKK